MATAVIMTYNKWPTNSNSNRNQLLLSDKWFQTNRFRPLSSHPWPTTTTTTIRSAYTIKDDQNINILDIKYWSDQTVVRIFVSQLDDCDQSIADGSGFRVNGDEMMIITSAHVVKGSNLVEVLMHYYGYLNMLLAQVVYVEQHRDLALLNVINLDSDRFQSLPFDTRSANDLIGQPVASIGHMETIGEKSCQSGIIQSIGMTNRQQRPSGQIYHHFYAESCPLLSHSSPIFFGYSGGPALTSLSHMIGVQTSGRWAEGFYYAVTCSEIFDFIGNYIHYAVNGFIDRQLNRTVSYTLRPGLKLGLILLSNTIDDNNNSTEFTIVNTIPESPNV
ncbi:uncharacterized protein LOC128955075 [Oppia nitens]|uniref:uncharacterized protein LOC128955075 n=1 Tax=Oppia nitens TaxID=1686743 RepID=UPI0023DC4C70|nr:uncharacterized protein LOC128955075 [Oppia nitens]